MQKLPILCVVCGSLLLLPACQTTNRAAGTAIGATAGALVGSLFGKGAGQLVGIAAGALIGSVIGNVVGGYLDDREAEDLARATQSAVENSSTGERVAWSSKGDGGETTASGWIVPTSDFYEGSDGTCRKVQQIIMKDGERIEEEVELCTEQAENAGGRAWEIPT